MIRHAADRSRGSGPTALLPLVASTARGATLDNYKVARTRLLRPLVSLRRLQCLYRLFAVNVILSRAD